MIKDVNSQIKTINISLKQRSLTANEHKTQLSLIRQVTQS